MCPIENPFASSPTSTLNFILYALCSLQFHGIMYAINASTGTTLAAIKQYNSRLFI